MTDTNQKLREALQAISHIDDSTNHTVDASAALDRIGQIARQALALPTAATEQTVPSVVWIVSNKTSSTVFATEEFAQKFISSFSGSVAGGFSVSRVDVIGARQPAPDAGVVEDVYAQGWIAAAGWAMKPDLIADVDSPAYTNERDGRLMARGYAALRAKGGK